MYFCTMGVAPPGKVRALPPAGAILLLLDSREAFPVQCRKLEEPPGTFTPRRCRTASRARLVGSREHAPCHPLPNWIGSLGLCE